MKILVLNGSPAGENSITLQTVKYLEILFPEHEYTVLHVGQQIRKIEKDFTQSAKLLENAELIIFCYPVYTFLVPAQLHRFIELIVENNVDISNKYAAQITTSKHFYDNTAHRFISDNCIDLKLKYISGLSADMEDLRTEKGQEEAEAFFSYVLWNIENDHYERADTGSKNPDFTPVTAADIPESRERKNMKAALVTDLGPGSGRKNLTAMIERFRKCFPGECELIDLQEFPFRGGCLGCFNCASDGKCIYKDGFDDYLRTHINSADAVVYAYTIKNHSMGSRFKLYDDRQFCNGHRTVTMGKPVAYLVDGDLGAEDNLKLLMEARAQVGGNFLAGIAGDSEDPDGQIDQMTDRLVYAIEHKYTQPQNFYGTGGLKIFRDLIYQMQGLMKEDHRFYKEHGFYDFPQKKKGRIIGMYLVSAMMSSKKLQKKMKFSMTDGMLMPYKKVIEKAKNACRHTGS